MSIRPESATSNHSTAKRTRTASVQIRVDIKAGIHTPDSSSITVSEAGERWITACTSAGLERTTIDSYRSHLDLHIVPFLGRRKLSQLTIPMVTDFERTMRSGTEQEKPRSAPMIKRVLSDLGAILATAQEDGLVARNVVREMRSSRRRGKERQAERRAKAKLRVGVDIPAPEEIKAIVAALDGKWRPILLTAIFTGLRASELRGLRRPNVDLTKRDPYVRRTRRRI